VGGLVEKMGRLGAKFDEILGILPAEQTSEFVEPSAEQKRLNAMTPLQREALANARMRAATEEQILETRLKQAEALQNLPDQVLEGYGLAHIGTGIENTFKAIGSSLIKDFGSVSELISANLGLAQEAGSELVRSGRKFAEESKLGILQRRLQELQNERFTFEVAGTFASSALREALGIGSGDVDEEQLETQKEMRDLLRKIEAKKSLIAVL